MNERETGDLTPAMLAGTPIGGPGGFAACDTCNKGLTDSHREHDPDDKQADTVVVYATRAPETTDWALRWVSCEDCGPPGEAKLASDDPAEVVATATLAYDARLGSFVLAGPELPITDEGGDGQ